MSLTKVGEKHFSVVNHCVPRIDGVDKVTGRARYAADIYMEGMLYAGVLRSPYSSARVVSIDAAKAKAIPESFKVLLKEMQSLGLDVQVLRDDGTEVEMNENIDYGDTELRAMLEGERRFEEKESYAQFGYQEQEFKDSELVAVEEEEEVSADDYTEEADDEDDLFLDEAADGEDEE